MQITNEDDLRNMMMNAPVGICVLEAATLVSEMVNDKFLEVAGKPYDAVAGKFYWDAFAEARPYHEAALNSVVKTGNAYYANQVEVTLVPHGKEKIPATFVYSPIKNEKGKVTKIAIWVLENTTRVAARQQPDEDGLAAKEVNQELAATNEELAAANEELAASNEELAAVNEELAAANEELASVNEELAVTNEELAVTNDELTKTQADLQRSDKLFRSVAVNLPNALIVVIDKEHRYLLVEGDLMEKMGYDRRHYEGYHPTEIGQTERYNASKHLYDRMMAGERMSLERKGLTGENYIVHLVPLRDENDEVYAGLVMAVDVTEIKQAEEKSAKLAAIIESSDDAIVSKTLESVITSWNDSAERMFGYTADEIIGETIYKLIPEDRQDEEPQILSRLKSGERVEHFETKRITKAGKLIDVSVTVSPVKDKAGNLIGLSKIARDITEKKLDETRKNDFIGMVSHELKTPLTSLTALIQVAHGKAKKGEDTFLTGAMEKAGLQVKRMTAMINGFLNISRLEAGKIHIEKQHFDLGELLNEIMDETRLIVGSHHINLTACSNINLNADRDKISSVISNLISNAVKYSPRGKQIDIKCNVRDKMVIVSVKDEGMGIKLHDLDKIFDRYYRVETHHTRHISGFGIGLYLSAEIIKGHGGEIWAESESGKGSTFYFSLPIE